MKISLSRRSKRANDSHYHTLAKRHGPPILRRILHHGVDNPFVPMDVDPDDPVKINNFQLSVPGMMFLVVKGSLAVQTRPKLPGLGASRQLFYHHSQNKLSGSQHCTRWKGVLDSVGS